MFLLDLPPYFLVSLFRDWVSLKDVCYLDSSICNTTLRSNFHHIIRVYRADNFGDEVHQVNELGYEPQSLVISSVLQENIVTQKIFKIFQIKIGDFSLDLGKLILMAESLKSLAIQTIRYEFSIGQMAKSFKQTDEFGVELDVESGGCYIGEFNHTKREGIGEQHWLYGTNNSFRKKLFHPSDALCRTGSQTYSGGWLNDMCHGFGIMKYVNCDVYTGEWIAHVHHGHGIMYYGDGTIFDGEWCNGCRIRVN